MKNCPDCNSQKIINNVKVIDRGHYHATSELRVGFDQKPDALVFKQSIYSVVKAKVCADCGHVNFYAENPQLLWQTYQNQQKDV